MGTTINIAGHRLRIPSPVTAAYEPFVCEPSPGNEIVVLDQVVGLQINGGEVIGDYSDQNGRTVVRRADDQYIVIIYPTDNQTHCAAFACSEDFRKATIEIFDSKYRNYALGNALMMLFAFATSDLDTLLFHSSVVVNGGKAYMMLGKSGTGKSTHSRMWMENIEATHLLNDDNPVVRIEDGRAVVYGSPWSGKTPCYRAESYPLGAIIRIWQRAENEIRALLPVEAMAAILPTVSKLPCVRSVNHNIIGVIERLVPIASVYWFGCRPDAEAAQVCHRMVAR